MTETEFWMFLKRTVDSNGQMDMVAGSIDSNNSRVSAEGRYINGHSVLFNGHDKLPDDKVEGLGHLLFDHSASARSKEAILMILAHHPTKRALDILCLYNMNPDNELRFFAETALWECKMWNE